MRVLTKKELFIDWMEDISGVLKKVFLMFLLFPFFLLAFFMMIWIARSDPTRDPFGGAG